MQPDSMKKTMQWVELATRISLKFMAPTHVYRVRRKRYWTCSVEPRVCRLIPASLAFRITSIISFALTRAGDYSVRPVLAGEHDAE